MEQNTPTHQVLELLRWPVGVLVALILIGLVGVPAIFAGRLYPGMRVNGVEVGGKTRAQALAAVEAHDKAFSSTTISVKAGSTTIHFTPEAAGLDPQSTQAVDAAMKYGRSGNGIERMYAAARALTGRPTSLGQLSINSERLTPYVLELSKDVAVPVANAQFNVQGGAISVKSAVVGKRLDIGGFVDLVRQKIASGSSADIEAPVTEVEPIIATADLDLLKAKAAKYASAPIQLATPDNSKTFTLAQSDIVSWLNASRVGTTGIAEVPTLDNILHIGSSPISIGLDVTRVDAYVASLAGSVNQESKNAALAMVGGNVSVVQASKNGLTLDVAKSTDAVKAVLDKPADQRKVTLVASVTKPEVREDNLASLGIKDLIGEGTTYFPGSPSTRLINVRAGARKFNGVLLKPGETFSFGKLLGQVDASTGYVPELVILNNHEEKQYGGGLCQVSSTAFRAALAAGLPILERHNHSFAISYYTAPYGVPGVDATIYYPAVDFKFKNDTPGYLLMQTTMSGTTLTFDYFGTKTKSGTIRGPQFISGTTDATLPSHTVFWRDVKDLSGNVIKTDQFDTYYQSSKDFPITKQFN